MTSTQALHIAQLSLHSNPVGPLGSQNTGGMSVYVSELARWLGRSGHKIDIFTYTPGAVKVLDLHPNVRLIHLLGGDEPEPAKEQLPALLDGVLAKLEQFRIQDGTRYDLIHSHYWLSGVVGARARDLWQVPHMVTFHTLGAVKNHTLSGENEPLGRIAAERQLAQSADGVVVPLAAEKVHLSTYYQTPGEKVSTIACGVNLERFQPRDQAMVRKKLGMEPGDEVALYVGRFAPLKGVGALLQALARLNSRRPRLKVVLVGGDGPATGRHQAMLDQARDLGIERRVVFAGRIEPHRLADYYAAADFVALPSHCESFGLVVLEAMACGTPVLATPVGIAPSVIAEGINGTLVERPDAAAVAEGIVRLLGRSTNMRPSPVQVRATIAQFSWRRTAEAMASCYARAVASFAI